MALAKSFIVFGFSIRVTLHFNFRFSHSIDCKVKSQEMYTKAYTSFNVPVDGTFGPDFFFVSFGHGIRGTYMGGDAYIQGRSIYGSSLARFDFYKNFLYSYIDLYFYFTINFIFWKKTYETTRNLFRNAGDYINDYHYY